MSQQKLVISELLPNSIISSPPVFEIGSNSKRIRVTSLNSQGHVTSSVTWPFDYPYTISYWWSFNTTVSDIFNGECEATRP